VLQETDSKLLTKGVLELEEAIVLRGMELKESSEDEKESACLRQLASELLRIKTERLGWPGLEALLG
jgi:hypothetical protein